MNQQCNEALADRRRCFWSTQPCGCGNSKTSCGDECCDPGMSQLENGSIATNDWVRGLILNMLNTDKRRDPTRCGINPTDIRGHWSESFIDGESGFYGGAQRGYRVGTGLRYLDVSKYRIREIEALIKSELVDTLQKLVMLGIAQDISVEVDYVGNNSFNAVLFAYGPDGAPMGKVAIIGQRDEEIGFYWSC